MMPMSTVLEDWINTPPKKMVFSPLTSGSFKEFEVQYNPSSLSLSRNVGLAEKKVANFNWEKFHFESGKNDMLSFQLLLDKSEVRGSDGGTLVSNLNPFTGGINVAGISLGLAKSKTETNSITEQMQRLYMLTLAHEHKAKDQSSFHTEGVAVSWGDFSFVGLIASLKFDVLLFDKDGKPRRSTVDVEMKGRYFVGKVKEYKDLTSRAEIKSSDVSKATGDL